MWYFLSLSNNRRNLFQNCIQFQLHLHFCSALIFKSSGLFLKWHPFYQQPRKSFLEKSFLNLIEESKTYFSWIICYFIRLFLLVFFMYLVIKVKVMSRSDILYLYITIGLVRNQGPVNCRL